MKCKGHNNADNDDISFEEQTSLMGLVRKAIEHGETIASIKAILNNCIKYRSKGKYCVVHENNKAFCNYYTIKIITFFLFFLILLQFKR